MEKFCQLCGKPLDLVTHRCAECALNSAQTETLGQSQDEILKRQLAEKAKKAAAFASAGGSVVKGAFVATLAGATTTGEKAAVFGSLLGLISFFFPWFTVLGTVSDSGLQLALHFSDYVWLYPTSMVLVFVMTWFMLEANPQKRILAARWFIVIGVVWLVPALALLITNLAGVGGFGFYMALASSAAILLGGLLQISHRVKQLIPAQA